MKARIAYPARDLEALHILARNARLLRQGAYVED